MGLDQPGLRLESARELPRRPKRVGNGACKLNTWLPICLLDGQLNTADHSRMRMFRAREQKFNASISNLHWNPKVGRRGGSSNRQVMYPLPVRSLSQMKQRLSHGNGSWVELTANYVPKRSLKFDPRDFTDQW
jgi:hypothetical protein